jgi:hypothetical protein
MDVTDATVVLDVHNASIFRNEMYILAGFCVYIALFEKERDRDEWSGD